MNAPLTKWMSKTLDPFKTISKTLDTVILDENSIQNTVLMDWVMLMIVNARDDDIKDHKFDSLDRDQSLTEDRTEKDNARIISEFPWHLNRIVRHVGICFRANYVTPSYGYGPE